MKTLIASILVGLLAILLMIATGYVLVMQPLKETIDNDRLFAAMGIVTIVCIALFMFLERVRSNEIVFKRYRSYHFARRQY